MFTYALARRLDDTEILVNAVHPGEVRTGFGRKNAPWYYKMIYKIQNPFLLKPEEGAKPILQVATSNDLHGITGKYFARYKPKKSSKLTYDVELQEKLWDKLNEYCNNNFI